MAGFPQLREAGWLYGADPTLPLALVRLLEHRDGSGRWELRLNDPASGPTQLVTHPDEASARDELGRIYAAGEQDGTWRIRQPDAY